MNNNQSGPHTQKTIHWVVIPVGFLSGYFLFIRPVLRRDQRIKSEAKTFNINGRDKKVSCSHDSLPAFDCVFASLSNIIFQRT